jgi:hypothetical protein
VCGNKIFRSKNKFSYEKEALTGDWRSHTMRRKSYSNLFSSPDVYYGEEIKKNELD